VHEVTAKLIDNKSLLPALIQKELPKIIKVSKALGRDRELAFYGSEDLTPSAFYTEEDATVAVEDAKYVLLTVLAALKVKEKLQ